MVTTQSGIPRVHTDLTVGTRTILSPRRSVATGIPLAQRARSPRLVAMGRITPTHVATLTIPTVMSVAVRRALTAAPLPAQRALPHVATHSRTLNVSVSAPNVESKLARRTIFAAVAVRSSTRLTPFV